MPMRAPKASYPLYIKPKKKERKYAKIQQEKSKKNAKKLKFKLIKPTYYVIT